MIKPRVYSVSFASIYPLYISKAEKKNRTKDEVDQIIVWLTGYDQAELKKHIERQTDFESFFSNAPNLNPNRKKITGTICGIRVEEIKEPVMQEIRYLDKMIDELAKGKTLEKILRQE